MSSPRLTRSSAREKGILISPDGSDNTRVLRSRKTSAVVDLTPSRKRIKYNPETAHLKENTPPPARKRSPVQIPKTPRTPSGILQEAKNLFRKCNTTEIIGREKERTAIEEFCDNAIENRVGGSLYISGYPGLGKTALVESICSEKLKNARNVKYIKLNCMSAEDPKMIYSLLHQELQPGSKLPVKQSFEFLDKIFLETSKLMQVFNDFSVVVLDEIDHLYTKDQSVLYQLFEWAKIKGSKLTLIGIANAMDLIDRILPRLKAKSFEPEILNFEPYKVEEIVQIISKRIQDFEKQLVSEHRGKLTPSKSLPLIQNTAIEFCARKVVGTGDLRKALDICRKAIENADYANMNSPLKRELINSLDEIPRVTVQNISQITSKSMGSTMSRKIQNMSLHHKLVLITIILWQTTETTCLTYSKLHELYNSICANEKNGIPRVTRSEFNDIVSILETQGLLSIGDAKDDRNRKILINARKEDVEMGISGDPILDNVFKNGIKKH